MPKIIGKTIHEAPNFLQLQKFDGTHYIAIITDNPVAPDTVIRFALCNCKDNIFFIWCLWGGYMIT